MWNFIYENLIDIISCVLAAVAIILSIKTWARDNEFNKKLAQKTFNQKFFEEIFFNIIITDMPKALSNLEYSRTNSNSACEDMENIIMDIFSKAMFYKYFDSDFYEKIKIILVDIDDKLVYASDNSIDHITFENYKRQILDLIHKLYSVLKDYYSGI